MTDNLKMLRKRLIYQSWYRGTKETDLLLGPFAKETLDQMGEKQLTAYEQFLNETDTDIYNWITGKEPAPEFVDREVLSLIQNYWYKSDNSN